VPAVHDGEKAWETPLGATQSVSEQVKFVGVSDPSEQVKVPTEGV